MTTLPELSYFLPSSVFIKRLESVFRRLKGHNLKLKSKKCEFFKTEIKYLGFIVYDGGIATDIRHSLRCNSLMQRSINLWNVEHAFVRPTGRRLNS
jgi:hypothetical protein